MRSILISLLMLIAGTSAASAVEFDYEFKREGCTNKMHQEYTVLMHEQQGKLAEVATETLLFYKAWAEAAGIAYDGQGDDTDVIFVFKSYPNAGILFAYNDGCLVGARVLPLDAVNNILQIYARMQKKGEL